MAKMEFRHRRSTDLHQSEPIPVPEVVEPRNDFEAERMWSEWKFASMEMRQDEFAWRPTQFSELVV